MKSLAKRLKEINDDLTQMNEDYVYHYWLVKDSRVGKLSRYERLGTPQEMYDPEKQSPLILLPDFSQRIVRVIRECNETIWSRKVTIAMAMVEVGRPAPIGRGGYER